ncbi:hypothetical protein Tco_0604848 [Tanacetum coccineum]
MESYINDIINEDAWNDAKEAISTDDDVDQSTLSFDQRIPFKSYKMGKRQRKETQRKFRVLKDFFKRWAISIISAEYRRERESRKGDRRRERFGVIKQMVAYLRLWRDEEIFWRWLCGGKRSWLGWEFGRFACGVSVHVLHDHKLEYGS